MRLPPPPSRAAQRILYLAGALSHSDPGWRPPVDREARRHFTDGNTLARQGYIRIVDAAAAHAFVQQLRESKP